MELNNRFIFNGQSRDGEKRPHDSTDGPSDVDEVPGTEEEMGLVNLHDLVYVTQNTVMNVNQMSEQMGLLSRRTDENTRRIVALEAWKDRHELTETVNHVEYDCLYRAVHNRAKFLLKLKYDENGNIVDECRPIRKKYYGRLVSRIWNDAKKYSRMARSYRDTLKRDYDEVMSYLGAYVPRGGMQAFMEDVDKGYVA